jgi:hypothetical protein
MKTRAATSNDFEAVLTLNHESERFLSPLSAERLVRLHSQADLHRVLELDGTVVAFVLALREGADYDSVNYRWFTQRYGQFLYVDRVVVSGAQQGRGFGQVLYRSVFARARQTEVPLVACEYDVDPPNPSSERFHRSFGFSEVGRQSVAGGKKWVSLQVAQVRAKDA